MSRWLERRRVAGGGARLALAVEADAMAWLDTPDAAVAWRADATPDWDALCPRLAARAGRGATLAVTVADHWCRWWCVEPPAGVRRLAALQAAAATQFEARFGASAADWAIDADWHTDAPFVAAALPRALLLALRQLAAERGWTLMQVVPASSAAATDWLRRERGEGDAAWLCTVAPTHAVAWWAPGGRPTALLQAWYDEPPGEAELAAQLRRLALAQGIAAPLAAHVADVSLRTPLAMSPALRDADRHGAAWRLPSPAPVGAREIA